MGIHNADAHYLRYFAGGRGRTGKAAARGEIVFGLPTCACSIQCSNATLRLTSGVVLKDKLLKTYNPETYSLRFYHLGSKWRRKVEHHGAKPAVDVFKDVLIV